MDNLAAWGRDTIKAWTKQASVLEKAQVVHSKAVVVHEAEQESTACAAEDLKHRAQLQNKLAGVCEDMCKEVGAYPQCSGCPNFVQPDSTPGVMTWEELLEHMDNLAAWGRDTIKAWTKQASVLEKTEVGAYPQCSGCPNFVQPDLTPGVMTWEELLEH